MAFNASPLPALARELENAATRCIRCKLCQKECEFLRKHGKPADIAASCDPNRPESLAPGFECSLCGLCAAVCPVEYDPSALFLAMRRAAVAQDKNILRPHSVLLAYESRGTSRWYTHALLPKGCDTVFFPGCTLPGTRPRQTMQLFHHLRSSIPSLGMVLDCCTKPSHDLGRRDAFESHFPGLRDSLLEQGVQTVLLACPNCFKVFHTYGGELEARMVYDYLAANRPPEKASYSGEVVVHDSCVLRRETGVHQAVRDLVQGLGFTVAEMEHSRENTVCCGEGGGVGLHTPILAKGWTNTRIQEADGRPIVGYCAGCVRYLQNGATAAHIVDLLFPRGRPFSGKGVSNHAPFTCLNRLLLKRRLKKKI